MRKSLVFIHGMGIGEWVFQQYFVPHYRLKGYEVHTFNLPGHTAKSTELERRKVTLGECVRFVAEYLSANIHSPCVITGMSMGGAVCQKLLLENAVKENIHGMVLLSSVPPRNNLAFTLRLCGKLAARYPQALIDFFNDNANSELLFSPHTLSQYPEKVIGGYIGKILHGFTRLAYEIFFQDVISDCYKGALPLKIIGGTDDVLFPPEVAHFTASCYSQQAEILPGLGHMIPLEMDYIKGIQAIDSFLEEIFQSG